jgi:hypothetical protein
VSEIEIKTVLESFGEDEVTKKKKKKFFLNPLQSYTRRTGTGWYSMFQSSANAYMLLYRRIEPTRNIPLPKEEDVPAELRKSMVEEDEKAKIKREQEEYERSMIKLTVNFRGGEKVLNVHEKTTLGHALKEAAKLWDIEKKYPEDCVR